MVLIDFLIRQGAEERFRHDRINWVPRKPRNDHCELVHALLDFASYKFLSFLIVIRLSRVSFSDWHSFNTTQVISRFYQPQMESSPPLEDPPLCQVRVAVTQAEPVWLDLDATVDKTCKLITEAASNDAQLITFPECWVPGYPAWIWYVSLGVCFKSWLL